MTKAQWIATSLVAVALGALVLLAVVVFFSERSAVIIENAGEQDADVTVDVVNAQQFSWRGRLRPGERVVQLARFSDNSFRITCKDSTGEHAHAGGYVTNGMPQVVTIKVDGCANVSTDVDF
ncbi:hypothetical protein [Brevundimonas sp.]|uniref:hypothetical protein n=1 Tax=Brevundimonas sp. TaxID=1871086 RepID=UPI002BBCEEC0|nr:hypothetical protein [Brevundimonas sp.]HWQ88200.1 hypothetical protein [Brevundimonas sp.]